jgi:hypothetical protein
MVAGFVIWFTTNHPKGSEAGRIMFWTGLFVSLVGIFKT